MEGHMGEYRLTSPEGKIVIWRLIRTPLSPIVLGMGSFLALLAVGYVFQPTRPWLMWASPTALGIGVFLFAWAKAIDKLKFAEDVVANGATSSASGQRVEAGYELAGSWVVETPEGAQYTLRAPPNAPEGSVCYVDGLKLYGQWVGGQVSREKTPPPFLDEMFRMGSTDQARAALASGSDLPVIEVINDGLRVRSGREQLYALLGDGVPAFPIQAYDEYSAGRLKRWAGI